jgi:hypothetical protein
MIISSLFFNLSLPKYLFLVCHPPGQQAGGQRMLVKEIPQLFKAFHLFKGLSFVYGFFSFLEDGTLNRAI